MDDFEFWTCGSHNLGYQVKLKKYLVGTLEATFIAQ